MKATTGGRYLHFPGYEHPEHHTIANLYNTLLHATGKPTDEFGRMDLNLDPAVQRGPLVELLA